MAKENLTHLGNTIELAKTGDKAALTEIIRRYDGKITSILYALKANPDDILDLKQEILFKIAKNIKNLRSPKNISAWISQIVHRQFYDSLRKKKNKFDTIDIDNMTNSICNCDFKDSKQTPIEHALSMELSHKIRNSINLLPKEFKYPLIMRDILGLSYEDIGKKTNANIGTVKSRIARARGKIQESVQKYCEI